MENLYILFSPKFWLYLIRKSPLKAAVVILIVGFFVWGLSSSMHPLQPGAPDKQSEAVDKKYAETQEQQARVAGVLTYIQDHLRNPDSFKSKTALVTEKGDVCCEYRAQNGFGGMDIERAVGVWDGTNVVVFPTMNSSKARKAWADHCAGHSGTDPFYIK